MYLCYVDESGVPQIPGNTSHYILCGLSIPAEKWRACDKDINALKDRWHLSTAEVHTAWMARPYLEQKKIAHFSSLCIPDRIAEINRYRKTELIRLQRAKNPKLYHQQKKNFIQTEDYIHLTHEERHRFLMSRFHVKGTFWTRINNIIETPLFVDSKLTSMVQVADLCSFAIRRYLENNETGLFDRIILRADRKDGKIVGVRHFTQRDCSCAICSARKV